MWYTHTIGVIQPRKKKKEIFTSYKPVKYCGKRN